MNEWLLREGVRVQRRHVFNIKNRSAPLPDNFLATFPTSEVLVYLAICRLW